MKLSKLIIFFGLVFGLQYASHALDASTTIKAATVLKADKSWDGKPIVYPQGNAEVSMLMIEIAPGAETGWHLHPLPSFAMVLEGELEVTLKTGETKKAKAGDAFAEVVNTLHNGKNIGTTPVKLLVFYTGTNNQKLTIKENTP